MKRMISIVLTAWKEERSAGKAAKNLLASAKLLDEPVEFILVCPDGATYASVKKEITAASFKNFRYIKDPRKGKPYALNLAQKRARGEIIVSTDGDVFIDENALPALLAPFGDDGVGGVTGRPVSSNDRSTMLGYWGHMFMDAAHKRRGETLTRGGFFLMSGYLLAIRSDIRWDIPDGVLDDVYFSYRVNEEGLKIAYAPDARVYVKQPTTMRDWLAQKGRSLGGHQNLKDLFEDIPVSRSFAGELAYVLFPLTYAEDARELLWSLVQYPVRLYTWLASWWGMKVKGESATDLWQRTESTK